jgi:enediyne biosynthesis protein E4
MSRTFPCLGLLLGAMAFGAAAVETYGQVKSEPTWNEGPGYRYAPLPVPKTGRTGFSLLPARTTGIQFTNFLALERHLTNQILLNGSGVALGDADGDGWCDIYLCCLDAPNRLFRNLGGWRFADVTEEAGVGASDLTSTGAVFADLDGDGDLDLIVNSVGQGTHVFYNNDQGRFHDMVPGAGLNGGRCGTSLTLGDVDGDGYLDVYITNYRVSALMDAPYTHFNFAEVNGRKVIARVNGRPVTEPDLQNRYVYSERSGVQELGEMDVFLRNLGGTNLAKLPLAGGLFLDEDGKPLASPPLDWGLCAAFRDLNGDGLPDLYICNDFDSPDRVWLNQDAKRFRAAPRLAFRKNSYFSMGVDFADVNRDGCDDIFVLDMRNRDHAVRMDTQGHNESDPEHVAEIDYRPAYMMNTLSLNRGDGTYAEIAQLSGIEASDWSWTPVFLDVDLDGWEDLLISNGNERTARSMDMAEKLRAMREGNKLSAAEVLQSRRMFPRDATANVAFHNRRNLAFEDKSKEWGFDLVGVSHGMALADLDHDGDLDVVVNNLNGAVAVYRNESTAPRLAVRLKGAPPNTQGIGALIKVRGGPVAQSQQVTCGGRYMSADDPIKVFAAGAATNLLTIEVTWRSGKQSVVREARANCLYEIDESQAQPGPARNSNSAASSRPHFIDVSQLLKHVHEDDPFRDQERQPMLVEGLSHWGPGVTWTDLDGDGRVDLVVGSGKGGHLGAFRNRGDGTFEHLTEPPFNQPITRDQTTILSWAPAPGQTVLLAGSDNYEDGLALGGCIRSFDLADKSVKDEFPGRESSTGPLALADWDGEGRWELFVGGRCLPGQYPRPASSALFRRAGNHWDADAVNNAKLEKLGLVNGAVFSDLDGDGDPDLILACAWSALRVFRNDSGQLTEVTDALGLNRYRGLWNGVTTADFDGDGRLDIVASNWGRNSRFQAVRDQRLQLWFGDFDENGTVELMESNVDPSLKKRVPLLDFEFLAKGFPLLKAQFTSHQAFGRASLEEILGPSASAAAHDEINWLESTLFLNRGDHFEVRPLPVEAQMAPAFGICAGDLDGDGFEDLFLSQNFFDTPSMVPRYDAGRGLYLRGDGQGGFTPVAGQESGLTIYGQQRGCALADFNADGRVDLVVAQNAAETKLYRNQLAKPGLRVRLQGPPQNPTGTGAVLRLRTKDRLGPAREIHAGSGFWSQDDVVQVMAGGGDPPSLVWVRWPGGKIQTKSVPAKAKEITVTWQDQEAKIR